MRIPLPVSFTATGRHFVSVQTISDLQWYCDTSNTTGVLISTARVRDRLANGAWTPRASDASFFLYGTQTGPPVLENLLEPSAPLSGRVRISGVAFLNQTGDALVADAGDNKVFFISKVSGAAAAFVLRDQSSGIAAPVAVRASRDGLRVFVLNSKPAGIVEFEPKTGITKVFPCPASLTVLDTLNGNALFRLNELTHGPLWVFDGDAHNAGVFFVPALHPIAPAKWSGPK
jgi:hypothetical protein